MKEVLMYFDLCTYMMSANNDGYAEKAVEYLDNTVSLLVGSAPNGVLSVNKTLDNVLCKYKTDWAGRIVKRGRPTDWYLKVKEVCPDTDVWTAVRLYMCDVAEWIRMAGQNTETKERVLTYVSRVRVRTGGEDE